MITIIGEDVEMKEHWCTIGKKLDWKTVWRLLKRLKIELLYNPAIPLLDTYLKKTK